MPRQARITLPKTIYHLIWRGNRKQKIFKSNKDRLKFLLILKDVKEKYPFLIFAFTLMSNHPHLLLETKDVPLSKIMHLLGTRYTVFFNKKYNLVGHLFQDRFKSIIIDSEPYLWEVSRYIPLNPVKDEIVEKPEDYRWSSYPIMIEEIQSLKPKFYTHFEKTLIEKLVDKEEFFKRFFPEYEKDPKEAIRNYKRFVEEGIKRKIWQEEKWREHDLI